MMEAVAKGIIPAKGFYNDPRAFRAWTKCSWSGSSPGSIDPLKEIMAADKRIKAVRSIRGSLRIGSPSSWLVPT